MLTGSLVRWAACISSSMSPPRWASAMFLLRPAHASTSPYPPPIIPLYPTATARHHPPCLHFSTVAILSTPDASRIVSGSSGPTSPHPRFPHCRGFRVAIHISGTGQDHFSPASSIFPSGNCILKLSRSTHCGQPSLGRENQLSQWSSAYCHFTLLRHPRPPARASVHRTQPPATLHLLGPSMRTKDPSGFARRGAQRS
jgi:hypothetical protein